MPKSKVKENDKVCVKEIFAGTLDKNPFTLTFGIPGRGKLKMNIVFEPEEDKINLTL